jgi:hypothetical protein
VAVKIFFQKASVEIRDFYTTKYKELNQILSQPQELLQQSIVAKTKTGQQKIKCR